MAPSDELTRIDSSIQDLDDEFDEINIPENGESLGGNARRLEEIFEQGRFQIQQERNDFTLPQILDFVKKRTWINVRPEYQRRLRWDQKKKSRLIESLLINVPIPPIFLYEYDIARYETMDGQQRLNSVVEFINNEFSLSGLVVWSSLNGKRFSDLPPRIRRGLERAKLSSIVLIADTSANTDLDLGDIRIQVFDRLNTGGEKLNAQELRNSLYSGPMNDLIVELAGYEKFTRIWEIPSHRECIDEEGTVARALRENALYKTMKDCEIVLRFFAFRDNTNLRGSVRDILDRFMRTNREATKKEIRDYREIFVRALDINFRVFGKYVFRLPPNKSRRRLLSRPLYDAQMIAADRFAESRDELISARRRLRDAMERVVGDGDTYDVVIAKPNTSRAIKQRILRVMSAFQDVLE